jgi:hypothetical protein
LYVCTYAIQSVRWTRIVRCRGGAGPG